MIREELGCFIIFILLIIFLVWCFSMSVYVDFYAPCSELGNLTLKDLPARCLIKEETK